MNRSTVEPVSTVAAPQPLRIWPALVLLSLLVVSQLVPLFTTEWSIGLFMFSMFMPLLAGVGMMFWWILASRATARERLLGPLAVLLVAGASWAFLHPSVRAIAGGTLYLFVLPCGLIAAGLALVVLARARPAVRLRGAILGALIGFASWNLVRTEGSSGDFKSWFAWRWTPTAEARYLASLEQGDASPAIASSATVDSAALDTPAWPGFRGAKRDGIVTGVALEGDWQAHRPKEVWRRQVGPGWSSFAVAGRSVFTQEQRGEAEVIVCYDADNGAQRWAHESRTRFWESTAGAGPGATPALADGRLFAVGATGLVHCLDPSTGEVRWQRDLTKDAEREPPMWGYASSPLVVGDVVIVCAGGAGEKGMFGYDVKSGEPRWSAAAGESYSSPHRVTFAGRDVVLMLTVTELGAIDPADGKSIWSYTLGKVAGESANCLQPLVLQPSGIVYGSGLDTRRINMTLSDEAPEFKSTWTSPAMKAAFNDYVAHNDSLYGFDGNIFACIDLETGKRHWKKGRYGNGQVLLLADADQLLVLSEMGDVVLLRANDKQPEELALLKVLTGKTWNHPVLVGNRLYVRNGEEAVCLELPLQSTATMKTSEVLQ